MIKQADIDKEDPVKRQNELRSFRKEYAEKKEREEKEGRVNKSGNE